MTRARLFVVVVIASLVVAAVVLSPRRDERAAMLAGEGRHAEAIALLQRRLADAPGDPDLLAALARSYAALGETASAIVAFDAYLAARPDDSAAREREAKLFLQGGDVDRYLAAMARAVAARPTPVQVTQLVELYRLYARDDDEIRTLTAYGTMRLLDPAQLERLGALLAARGDWRGARTWLEQADLAAPPDAAEGRLLLLEVAIRLGAVDAIDGRAKAWMAGWRSPYLSGRLLLRIAGAGNAREAARLASAYSDLAPEDALDMAGLLVGKGFPGLGRLLLVGWSERADVEDGPHLRAFVQTAARLGEPSVVLRKLMRLSEGGADPSARGQLAEDLVDAFGSEALAAVRPFLSREVLGTRPLFAAEIADSEGNPEAARWYLRRVDPGGLRAGQGAVWLALCRRLQMEPEAKAGLARLLAERRIPDDLVPRMAGDAARLDPVVALDLIWNASGR
jgi:tetratricopeptide (TPR) repeat protein